MRKFLFLLTILFGVCFTACESSDPATNDPDGSGSGGGVATRFSLNINLPGSRINQYAITDPVKTESDIYSLHVLFFEATTNGLGEYKGHYSVNIPNDQPLNINDPVDIDLGTGSGISNADAHNVFVVANIDWYLNESVDDWLASLQGTTENELVNNTKVFIQGEPDETVYSDGLERLVMSGKAYKEPYATQLSTILTRNVARIDVVNYANQSYDLVSASMWNAFPYSSVWEGDVDFENTSRIQRYYGIKTEVGSNGLHENIEGGLYVFDNYVESPAQKDKKTTCTILGLRNRDVNSPDYNKVLYYRVNIHSVDNPQNLKRNNSYNVTIRSVMEKGYNTELEAYLGESDKLDIVINYWDLDDDGIIQYDGDNVLAVPMKRINIPREGDEREYSIFTIGDGTLTISKKNLPQGISARLEGNMLHVTSQPLPLNETERNGSIELTFGTLKAVVYIRQGGGDAVSGITLTPANIPAFPAYGITESGIITVNSSGPWKAKIHNPGFSFRSTSLVTEISSDTHGDGFLVSCISNNEENTSRYGFVVVSLESDPNVNCVLVLHQRGKSSIKVSPDLNDIVFRPTMEVAPGSENIFKIDPGDDGSTNPKLNPWKVELSDPAHFSIGYNYDPNVLGNNIFAISPKAVNTSTEDYTTKVKIYLENEPNVYKEMKVTQGSMHFSVTPTEFEKVPAYGKILGPIKVSATESMTWTASIWTSTQTNQKPHKALLMDSEGNMYTEMKNVSGDAEVYIYFPRLSLINVEPMTTVYFRLDNTNRMLQFNIYQQKLSSPRQLNFHSKDTSYGTLVHTASKYSFINIYGDNLRNSNNFGAYATSMVTTAGPMGFSYGTSIKSGTTHYHANSSCCINTTLIKSITNWLKQDRRNFLTVCIDNDRADQEKLLKAISGEFKTAAAGVKTGVKMTPANTPKQYQNNKVWEYIMKNGPFAETGDVNVSKVALYNGDANNSCLTAWPSTTIPLIMHPSYPDRAMLAIDPVLRLLIIGDTEIFCRRNTATNMNDYTIGNDNWKFLNNMLAFIVNAGQYGDLFMDEFNK